MTPKPPMRGPRLAKQGQQERVAEAAVDDTWVFGRKLVDGVGELEVDVDFAAVFSEKPFLIPCAAEVEGEAQPEHLPEVEMAVIGWKTVDDRDMRYTGARLVVRTAGYSGVRVWVSYVFVGKAFSTLET